MQKVVSGFLLTLTPMLGLSLAPLSASAGIAGMGATNTSVARSESNYATILVANDDDKKSSGIRTGTITIMETPTGIKKEISREIGT
jgi:hypothetical protein